MLFRRVPLADPGVRRGTHPARGCHQSPSSRAVLVRHWDPTRRVPTSRPATLQPHKREPLKQTRSAPRLTPNHPNEHHHNADADDPEVVPSHWRKGEPITLAGDIR